MAGANGTTKYVVGLGNPGPRYRGTRHNVGFMVLRELRRRWDFARAKTKFHSRLWTGRVRDRTVTLLAPQTYMNASGQAVAEALAFTRAGPAAALVVLDDMALPTGRLRVRAGGSAGGHKGLADILRRLPDDALPRLRIGIGRPAEGMDAVAYVLTKFTEPQRQAMAEAVGQAAAAVEDWIDNGITYVMDHYNATETET